MGGKGGGGGTTINQPEPVDPYKAANAQLGINFMTSLSNLYGNRIGQETPYGNLSYETRGYTKIDPKTGHVSQVDKAEPQTAMTATQFNQYKNAQNIHLLPAHEQELANLAKNFGNFTDYQNDFTANSVKFLPNQIQKMNLSPQQQKILDLQNAQDIQSATINNGQMDRVGKTLEGKFDPKVQNYNSGPENNDFSKDREKVEDATYSRFDKRFAKDEESLRARLANQGITVGSDAWKAEYENLNNAKNDAKQQSILAGGQEQSRMFGMNMQDAAFDNQLRGQQFQEELTKRQMPLNEYASLRSGQQIQNPDFKNFYQMNLQGGDIQGGLQSQYDQRMGAYNADVARKNNAKAGTNDMIKTGVMTGAMAFSDPVLKTDIQKVAHIRGFNIYKYRFIDNENYEIGVLADEIFLVRPDCVSKSDDGFLMVNYERLFGKSLPKTIN